MTADDRILCPARRGSRVRETLLNKAVARLGSHPDPQVRAAVVTALDPAMAMQCDCSTEIIHIVECSIGADWVGRCPNGHELGGVEN